MWRIKSSLMTSTPNNSDPPASNRNDPEDDGAVVVMDRPLMYSNVTAASTEKNQHEEPSSDTEGGITVVPAADEDSENNKETKEDNLSELSISPNQFTDSLLDAIERVEDDDNSDQPSSAKNETPQSGSITRDGKEDKVKEGGEGILVDELTKEEETFLAGLGTESVLATTKLKKTTDETAGDAGNLVTVEQVPENKNESSPAPANESLLEEHKEASVDATEDHPKTEEAETENEWIIPATRNEEKLVNEALLPVLRYFTTVLGLASFAALYLASFTDTPSRKQGLLYGNQDRSVSDVLNEFALADDNLPWPSATPFFATAPLSMPTSSMKVDNSTSFRNATELSEDENEELHSVETAWDGVYDLLLIASMLTFYYMICFWIRSDGPSSAASLLNFDGFFGWNECGSLNSFDGMLAFHRRFVRSGKGRRGTVRGGKCDASSVYDKLTRQELLKILDGFTGHYTGRDAAKFTLIGDLCSTYEGTLYRFTCPQIMQILRAKGYSADTNMTKHELVTLAVQVGF